MGNRVVLGALPGGGYGLRVSRPGYDVLNTGLVGKELAFDSRWAVASRVFLSGTVTLTPAAVVYHTVNFGTTFSVPPPVLLMQRAVSGSSWQMVDGTLNNSWLPTGGYYEPARIFTDRIEILRPFTGSNREVCYLVLRPQ